MRGFSTPGERFDRKSAKGERTYGNRREKRTQSGRRTTPRTKVISAVMGEIVVHLRLINQESKQFKASTLISVKGGAWDKKRRRRQGDLSTKK